MSNSEILEQNNQKLAELTETLSQKALSQVPAGGTTDQILAKASDADYDTKWVDAPSGDEKLYRHVITQGSMKCIIENNSADVFTILTLNQYLYNNGFRDMGRTYPAQWSKKTSSALYIAKGIYSASLNQSNIIAYMDSYNFSISDNTINIAATTITDSSTSALTDTVIEL